MKFKEYLAEDFTYKTDNVKGHTHDVVVDADGDGKTVGKQDHEHIIFQWMVQPAKGHIHNLEI
jgi:hypothetical protein